MNLVLIVTYRRNGENLAYSLCVQPLHTHTHTSTLDAFRLLATSGGTVTPPVLIAFLLPCAANQEARLMGNLRP